MYAHGVLRNVRFSFDVTHDVNFIIYLRQCHAVLLKYMMELCQLTQLNADVII